MRSQLDPSETRRTPVFGKFCPYYWISAKDGRLYLADTFAEIISMVPEEQRFLDPTGCLELLTFGYLLGSRTLVQGIGRLLWRTQLQGDGTLDRYDPIPHGSRVDKPRNVAEQLRQCLEEELATYISGANRVWILLSGGLDSRIVTGILAHFQKTRVMEGEIHAVTWGQELARDVVYAQRIADYFGWPLHRIAYDANLLWGNIGRAVSWGGAEISGIHLHGMCKLRSLLNANDVVIAASWGNSIGRGLFLGHHLSDLQIEPIGNPLDLIAPALQDVCIQQAERDRATAWARCSDDPAAIVELDQQENYMRRMIGQAMDYIRQFARLEQVFTEPSTVTAMWSYAPESRVAAVYFHLLEDLDEYLFNLPDANTGIAPSGLSEPDPILQKYYNRLGLWCRKDLRDNILEVLHSPALAQSGVLNMYAVKSLVNSWLQEDTETWGSTERITNLVGIALAISEFGLLPVRSSTHISDYLYSRTKRFKARARSAANRIRRWLP